MDQELVDLIENYAKGTTTPKTTTGSKLDIRKFIKKRVETREQYIETFGPIDESPFIDLDLDIDE